jgi:long-chain fatty acid transport protein
MYSFVVFTCVYDSIPLQIMKRVNIMCKEKTTLLSKKGLCVALLVAAPMVTWAAGFQINETSARLQGQAMAGSASAAGDLTAIYNNPAILGTLKKDGVYVGASYIAPHISMKNASGSQTLTVLGDKYSDAASTQSSQSNVAKSAVVPSIYMNKVIADNFVAGLAITAPWGLTTDYDNDSAVKYMAQKTGLETVNISPMFAFNVNSKLTLGGGLQAQYASAEFSNYTLSGENVGNGIQNINVPTINLPLKDLVAFPAGFNAALQPNQPSDVKGSGWGFGYELGLLYKPTNTTNIGLSYRSEVDYQLQGHVDQYLVGNGAGSAIDSLKFTDVGNLACAIDPSVCALLPALKNGLHDIKNSQSSASASFVTPAVLNLSVSQKVSKKMTVHSTLQMTFWNALQEITVKMPTATVKSTTIDMHWKNSLLYSLGADYQLNKRLTLRGGAAYDETPTNDTDRDPRIPDANRTWLTAGATYHVAKHFDIDAAYEHIFMPKQHIDVTKPAAKVTVPGVGSLEVDNQVQADYTGDVNIFALGMKYTF